MIGGRAKAAEVYPPKLCRATVTGLIKQMKEDRRITSGDVAAVVPDDKEDDIQQFWDDISGKPLDIEGVRKARREELEELKKHNVYRKVPVSKCLDETGKPPVGKRWLDINEGDDVHPEFRSRLVAQEIKFDKREDLFAATPPLEAMKLLFTLAVTEGVGYKTGNKKRGRK